jgi:hypothetical protein
MAGMLLASLLGVGGGALGKAYGRGDFSAPKGSPSTGYDPEPGPIAPAADGAISPDVDAMGLQTELGGTPDDIGALDSLEPQLDGGAPGEVVAPSYVQDKPYNMNVSNLQEVSKMQQAVPEGMQAPPPPPIRKPINLNPQQGSNGLPANAGQPIAHPNALNATPKPPVPTISQMNVGPGKPNAQGFVDPKLSQGQRAQQAVTRIK